MNMLEEHDCDHVPVMHVVQRYHTSSVIGLRAVPEMKRNEMRLQSSMGRQHA